MKKIVLTMMTMSLMLIGLAQRQIPVSEYVVSPALYDLMTPEQAAQALQDNPSDLIRKNYTINNFALVTSKLWDGNFQQMGMLEQYLPKGTTYVEEEIIEKGYVNPYLWNLPQDDYRYNLFKLRHTGYYVVVMPKTVWEERLNAHLHQYGF